MIRQPASDQIPSGIWLIGGGFLIAFGKKILTGRWAAKKDSGWMNVRNLTDTNGFDLTLQICCLFG